jgi:hypothetical protein
VCGHEKGETDLHATLSLPTSPFLTGNVIVAVRAATVLAASRDMHNKMNVEMDEENGAKPK